MLHLQSLLLIAITNIIDWVYGSGCLMAQSLIYFSIQLFNKFQKGIPSLLNVLNQPTADKIEIGAGGRCKLYRQFQCHERDSLRQIIQAFTLLKIVCHIDPNYDVSFPTSLQISQFWRGGLRLGKVITVQDFHGTWHMVSQGTGTRMQVE